MRTNPKSGSPRSEMGARAPRLRTPPQGEPVASTTVSEPVTSAGSPSFETSVPVRDQIARLAYSLWEARGGNGGSAEEDWYRAEQEILARSKS